MIDEPGIRIKIFKKPRENKAQSLSMRLVSQNTLFPATKREER